MITAGIDVGSAYIKILVMQENRILGCKSAPIDGFFRKETTDKVWLKLLNELALKPEDVQKIVSTGAGKYDVAFADRSVTEPVAIARAGRFFLPECRTVVDAGAIQTRVVQLSERGAIEEVTLNQKCGAGIGLFLETTAKRFGWSFEEMSGLPVAARGTAAVSDGCPVFAELDVLELLNKGVCAEDVLCAVIESAAIRIESVFNDKKAVSKEATALMGGIAGYASVTQVLKRNTGIGFMIPETAFYGTALGAALTASE